MNPYCYNSAQMVYSALILKEAPLSPRSGHRCIY